MQLIAMIATTPFFVLLICLTQSVTSAKTQTKDQAQPAPTPPPPPPSKCIKNCVCVNSTVYCESNGLTEVPPKISFEGDVILMDLSSNRLTRLAVGDSYPKLKTLLLTRNLIEEIEVNVFQKYPQLKKLDLSFNKLSNLPENVFAHITELEELRLQGNVLNILPSDIFNPLVNLKLLDLSTNPLKLVYSVWFENLVNLNQLYLSSCELSNLPESAFINNKKLELIDLSVNQFLDVPELQSAANLKHLILDNNPWNNLNSKSFYNMSSVERLEINECNEMIQVQEYTFSDMKSLRILNLNRNPHLIYVDRLAFQGLFDQKQMILKEVSMHKNTLSILDERTLPFDRLEKLDLRANPFVCDCAMAWARVLANRFEHVQTARCAAPVKMMGKQFGEIALEEFDCSTEFGSSSRRLHPLVRFLIGMLLFMLMMAMIIWSLIFLRGSKSAVENWFGMRKGKGRGAIYYHRATEPENFEMM